MQNAFPSNFVGILSTTSRNNSYYLWVCIYASSKNSFLRNSKFAKNDEIDYKLLFNDIIIDMRWTI